MVHDIRLKKRDMGGGPKLRGKENITEEKYSP